MKRFLLVANSPFTIVNFRRELILQLLSQNHEVHVICPSSCNLVTDENGMSELIGKGVTFHDVKLDRSSLNPFSEFKLLINFYQLIRAIAPDVVLNYTIKPTIYSSIIAAFVGVDSVYSNITGLGYAFSDETKKAKVLSAIVKLLYKFALSYNRNVFFQNPDDKYYFINSGIINHHKAVLINGSGVDTEYFKVERVSNGDSIKFLFVGRLLKDKGIFEYLEAAKIIKSHHQNVEFIVAGSYDSNPTALKPEEMDGYINLGIISYLGNVNDIKVVYSYADVFVLPSYREGTPRSTLEAMSMKMPIVTTDVPGCRETVEDGHNGFLVPHKSIDSLVKTFEQLIVDPSLRKRMGENSRKIAVNRFDVRKVNNSILSVVGAL